MAKIIKKFWLCLISPDLNSLAQIFCWNAKFGRNTSEYILYGSPKSEAMSGR